jgi:hypothetical protein
MELLEGVQELEHTAERHRLTASGWGEATFDVITVGVQLQCHPHTGLQFSAAAVTTDARMRRPVERCPRGVP